MSAVSFRAMLAGDVVQLALQASQHSTLGMVKAAHSYEDGEELVDGGPAWSALADGRIVACFGAKLLWPASGAFGGHAVAWAMLGEGLGSAHLAVTRYARDRLAESGFTRIEAIVRAGVKAECKWAELLGLGAPAALPAWGPAGEDHVLYCRIRRS